MVGGGSIANSEAKLIFQILEQISQGGFLVLFTLELFLFEIESRA